MELSELFTARTSCSVDNSNVTEPDANGIFSRLPDLPSSSISKEHRSPLLLEISSKRSLDIANEIATALETTDCLIPDMLWWYSS